MKTQKFKILSLRMALLTILLSGLSMQNIYAFSETTKNLPLNGRWEVNLTSGQYTLQMANNQGNYLTGVFGI